MTIQLRLMGTYFFGKSIMNSCCNKRRNRLGNATVHETHMRFCKRHPFQGAKLICFRRKILWLHCDVLAVSRVNILMTIVLDLNEK
jgi:hypothetical protein